MWSRFAGWRVVVEELAVGVAPGDTALFGGKFQGIFAIEFGLVHEFVNARGEGLSGFRLSAGRALFRRTNH